MKGPAVVVERLPPSQPFFFFLSENVQADPITFLGGILLSSSILMILGLVLLSAITHCKPVLS